MYKGIHPSWWKWLEKSRSIDMMQYDRGFQPSGWSGLKQTNSNIAGASERCIMIKTFSRWAG